MSSPNTSKRSLAAIATVVAAFLGISACSDSSDAPEIQSLTVTSYNAGLALNFVPYSNERLAANADLLAAYDTDVMCFQEVWLDDQVETLSDAVRAHLQ